MSNGFVFVSTLRVVQQDLHRKSNTFALYSSSSPVSCGPSRRLGAHEANAALCHDSNGNGNVLVGLTLLTRKDGIPSNLTRGEQYVVGYVNS